MFLTWGEYRVEGYCKSKKGSKCTSEEECVVVKGNLVMHYEPNRAGARSMRNLALPRGRMVKSRRAPVNDGRSARSAHRAHWTR